MLPVLLFNHNFSLDQDGASKFGASMRQDYVNASPYPHVVIDNFLPEEVVNWLEKTFPPPNLDKDRSFLNPKIEFRKRQVLWDSFSPQHFAFFDFMNSAPVLRFLESLTGIEGLVGDPYFAGGGFHEISRGGKLGLHADFRVHPILKLQRRINLLVYLNRDWQASYGGNLEIWDQGLSHCFKSVAPLFNRAVIFNTDEKSYHGHPEPLTCPEDRMRRSVALYYYTAIPTSSVPESGTMFVPRPEDSDEVKEHAFQVRMIQYLKDEMSRFGPTDRDKKKISVIAGIVQNKIGIK